MNGIVRKIVCVASSAALAVALGLAGAAASPAGAQAQPKASTLLSGKVTLGTRFIADGFAADDEPYYSWGWTSPVPSHLVAKADGSFVRVEDLDTKLLVESYSASGKLLSSKRIKYELPIYGGFFAGSDAYYLVLGKNNLKESNKAEVMRVIKYSKNWKRLGSCSVRGANTYKPFHAGSCRMDEAGGTLYIHTCHQMYKSEGGLRHQANMSFQVDEATMKVTDSLTGVAYEDLGYVSHSFDQYVKVDGENFYYADLGDAYPRGVSIAKLQVGMNYGELFRLADSEDAEWAGDEDPLSIIEDSTENATVLGFKGGIGANYTGAMLGGMELSKGNMLVLGAYENTKKTSSKVRNVFVTRASLSGGWTQERLIRKIENGEEYAIDLTDRVQTRYLTKYGASSKIRVPAVRLVKADGDHFLAMWLEANAKSGKSVTKIARLDGMGKMTGKAVSCKADLSYCEPVLMADGTVAWVASSNRNLVMYRLDPDDLKAFAKSAKAAARADDGMKVSRKGAVYRLSSKGTARLVKGSGVAEATFSVPKSIKAHGKKYKVTGISKSAFAGNKKVRTLRLAGVKFTEKSVKGSLAGSRVKTVKVKKSQLGKARKCFSKANCGKRVSMRS